MKQELCVWNVLLDKARRRRNSFKVQQVSLFMAADQTVEAVFTESTLAEKAAECGILSRYRSYQVTALVGNIEGTLYAIPSYGGIWKLNPAEYVEPGTWIDTLEGSTGLFHGYRLNVFPNGAWRATERQGIASLKWDQVEGHTSESWLRRAKKAAEEWAAATPFQQETK